MLNKIIFVLTLTLVSTGIAYAGQGDKILLCHSTNSSTNPTVPIMISPNAIEAQLELGSTFPRMLEDGSYTCTIEVDPV